ncbi:MAG: hypothetical protein HKN24_02270 [Acidimicrobiales bacterium]|nr:hypothetical protein [Acidimicrobiales bacterium]
MALFAEGLTTSAFPCSLVLAVPGMAVAVASRRSSAVAGAGFLIGLLASSWLRFAGIIGVWPSLLTGTTVLLAAIPMIRQETGPAGLVGLASASAGAATASLWRPCVGVEFGQVLTHMETSGLRGVAELAIYLLGVMAPVIASIAALNALPGRWLERSESALRIAGGIVLGIVAIATLMGAHERIIDELFRRSSF